MKCKSYMKTPAGFDRCMYCKGEFYPKTDTPYCTALLKKREIKIEEEPIQQRETFINPHFVKSFGKKKVEEMDEMTLAKEHAVNERLQRGIMIFNAI